MKAIKKLLLFIFLLLSIPRAEGQVSVMIRQPLPWHFTAGQVWNADIVNSQSSAIKVILKGSISTASGQMLLEGQSQPLFLQQGMNSLNASVVGAVDYRYGSQADANIRAGVFPYGQYNICMQVYAAADLAEMGGYCIEYELNVLSPPFLFSPYDEAELNIQYPLLSWSPPSPLSADLQVVYDLKLVEILPGQNAYDAIRRNYAQVEVKDIPVCYLQYPATALPLAEQKHYAWQVVARSNGYSIGETEIWTFTYVAPKMRQDKDPVAYSKVKKQQDGSWAELINGHLYFQFEEAYSGKELQYRIYDARHNDVSKKCGQKLLKSTGDNRFEIDIERCSSFKSGYYLLEVENEKKEKLYLSFRKN